MSVIFLLIPLSIVVAAGFLWAFIWAVRSGQYEDTSTPSMRVLLEDVALNRTEFHTPERSRRKPAAAENLPDLSNS